MSRQAIPWVLIDEVNKEMLALPLQNNLDTTKLELTATNSQGKSTSVMMTARVEDLADPNTVGLHQVAIYFKLSFHVSLCLFYILCLCWDMLGWANTFEREK